jgi:adenylate kinase
MNILLIGPPGSGKGTQGARLAEALGTEHIAVGDVLRAEVASGTTLGEELAAHLDRGGLAPDDLVLRLIMPRALAASARGGYVLDGFPRSVSQAMKARALAERTGARPDVVAYLDAPADLLVRRLLDRAQGRSDDTEKVIKHRLRVFEEVTAPLLEYYRGQGLTRVVDATRPPDEVTAAILAVVAEMA